MSIYTKTGDKGFTSNVLGERVSKGDIIMELQGTIDEINAHIGFLRSMMVEFSHKVEAKKIDGILRDIQYSLFRIGGDISAQFSTNYIKEEDIKFLEREIDRMTDAFEPLKSFIYYSGNKQATYVHVIRSVTRRAERVFVRALEERDYPLDYQFINRLSDYFYTLSRYINHLNGDGDEAMKLR
jgi:cob(I)alamin adenosyltransferase